MSIGEADHGDRSAEWDWRMWPLAEIERELSGKARDPMTAEKNDGNRESRAEARKMRRLLRPRYGSAASEAGAASGGSVSRAPSEDGPKGAEDRSTPMARAISSGPSQTGQ